MGEGVAPSETQVRSNTKTVAAVVIVTGLSGSGKSTALAVFEDMDFVTVDGLPVEFALPMAQMISEHGLDKHRGIALGMDLRQDDFLNGYKKSMDDLAAQGFAPRVIFFETKKDVLLKRYATTRRPHPLEKEGIGLEQALSLERHRLRHLRKSADLVIDTSSHSIHDLRRIIQTKWNMFGRLARNLKVHIISFGFKYGTPSEADMVLDLRFLPNPYFVESLKILSGLDEAVRDYVLKHKAGREFFNKLKVFMKFILKQNEKEGRYRLTLAIGCTGGRHRSVAIAEALADTLREEKYSLTLEHRHLELG
ncbi:MAG: RNase adapter RapZ [Desulfovibrio sp.]|jgi:UPF0042 nucleotide-binding protein|nr:RNase adapter RapZ [Desulfovibrio sp.]